MIKRHSLKGAARAGMGLCLLAAISSPGAASPEQQARAAEECRIIAVVAQSYHRLDPAKSKQVKMSGTYLPDCPWSAIGLRVTDARAAGNRWVTFGKPRTQGDRTTIRTGIMHGPLSGHGAECTLVRKDGDWKLKTCKRTWVS